MAQQVLAAHLPPHPGPFLDEEDLPESTLHHQATLLLELILLAWVRRLGLDALVAVNLACRWDASDARIGVDPDLLLTSPHPPMPPGRRSLKQLRLWESGHAPPRVTVEVVSESTAKKDYEEAPWAHAKAGTRELWVFDPELLGPTSGGGPFVLQVWRRQEDGTMKRVHAGEGPAWSEELRAWLVVTEGGTRLRLADDREGTRLWPTEAEARAQEAAKAQQDAEAKIREAAKGKQEAETKAQQEAKARQDAEAKAQQEAKARQDAEATLLAQTQARENAEKELQELRRRLAELEALTRPPSAE
jgi:Uma2 family endonuclease